MLTISGPRQPRFCDGTSRRDFLTIGTLGAAGLTLADLLRLKAHGAVTADAANKAAIIVSLSGGPPHLDMYDLKPNAPVEIRGEFRPIATRVPGMQICERLPRLAQIADKFAILRNMTTVGDGHQQHLAMTGFPNAAQRPPFGSIVSRLRGNRGSLPAYVSMVNDLHPENIGHEDPLYAGAAHRPFVPNGPGLANLGLARGVTIDRLADRKVLLREFDDLQRELQSADTRAGMDAFTAQALEVISSTRARDAFDLSREPDKVRTRYGGDILLKKQAMGVPYWKGSKFLLARRLVEAGVRVVTLNIGWWDTHQENFVFMREYLPLLDQTLSALITDLHERGLAQDVVVLVWGEFFGRSVRINKDGGRDHNKQSGSILLAGGGLRMGQVVGATDERGERPLGRSYHPQNVLATLYHVLGIDPAITLTNHSGRPMHLLDEREKVVELV